MVGCSFRGRAWLFEVPLLCQGLCTVPLKFSSGCEEVNGEHRLFRCLVVARCRMVQRWDTRACFLQSARWRGYAWRKWSGLQFAPRLHCVAPVLAIQSLRMCANRFVYWYQRSNRFVFLWHCIALYGCQRFYRFVQYRSSTIASHQKCKV